MNEYQIVDVLNNVTSNMLAAQALFISIVSAYLVVAYSVGRDLSFYQVSFVNVGFILFSVISFQSALGFTDMLFFYYDKLAELRETKINAAASLEFARGALIGVRLLLIVGALIFMWSVRHPRSDDG